MVGGDYFGEPRKSEVIGQKVDNDKYLDVLNYVSKIKDIKPEDNEEGTPWLKFVGVNGKSIHFVKFSGSESGYIAYDSELKFSDDEELNKNLLEDLVRRLKN